MNTKASTERSIKLNFQALRGNEARKTRSIKKKKEKKEKKRVKPQQKKIPGRIDLLSSERIFIIKKPKIIEFFK